MGAPYFQIKDVLRKHGIVAFSSNYALYGQISERVMTIIESMVCDSEVYSIDEIFCDFSGLPGNLTDFGRQIRAKVLKYTGIPVGVGIAHTKTLAKLANHTAKRLQAQTGGFVDLCDSFKRDWGLRNTAVEEVWGVGRRMTGHLHALGIRTAMDLAKSDPTLLGRKFSVVLEKTVRELSGTSCLALEDAAPAKQEICCSRTFGVRLTEIGPIKEAVASYAQRVSEKLRGQHSLCKKIRVGVRTGMFNPDEARYANGVVVELPYPTNDVRLITKAATQAVDHLFRPGFRYSKAEVMLMDLRQPGEFTDDLFAHTQPAAADKVMSVLDEINSRWGRGTLRAATVPASPVWTMRRELLSNCYTTRLDQLWTVNAN